MKQQVFNRFGATPLRYALAMMLGMAAGLLDAQGPAGAQEKGRITGTVKDIITRQPLPSAEVLLRGPLGSEADLERSAVADGEGRFVFPNLPPGRYMASASHDGYVLRDYDGPGGFRTRLRALASGEQIDDLVVSLLPGAVIAGHVLDENNQPVAGVSVEVMKVSYPRGVRELEPVAEAATNHAGDYRFRDVTPGTYFLQATFTPRQTAALPANLTYAPLCYPGGESSACMPLTAPAGRELAGLDFKLVPARAVRLAGRVVDGQTSLPMAGVTVSLLADRGGALASFKTATADVKGTFQFPGMTTGTYTVVAQRTPKFDAKKIKWGMEPVSVADTAIENLEITLSPGVEVRGRIRVDNNDLLGSAPMTAALQPAMSSALVALMPQVQDTPVNPDGSFIFHDVAEGVYRLKVFPIPSGFYLKAFDSDVLENGISIHPGASPSTIELVVSPGVSKVEGTVVSNDQSCAGASVMLVPVSTKLTQLEDYRRTTTNRTCHFTLPAVAPGDYTVFAWLENGSGVFRDSEFVRRFEDQAKSISLKGHADLNVQVEMLAVSDVIP